MTVSEKFEIDDDYTVVIHDGYCEENGRRYVDTSFIELIPNRPTFVLSQEKAIVLSKLLAHFGNNRKKELKINCDKLGGQKQDLGGQEK